MDDRLAHVLSRLRKRFSANVDVAEVEAFLSSEGFDRGQIGEIVSAFRSQIPAGDTGAVGVTGAGARAAGAGGGGTSGGTGVGVGQVVGVGRVDARRNNGSRPSLPFRVLGPHERGRFTTDAWGYLLSLAGSGMLSSSDFESVIDRALSQIEGRISLDDLKTLMDSGGLDDFGISPDQMTIH